MVTENDERCADPEVSGEVGPGADYQPRSEAAEGSQPQEPYEGLPPGKSVSATNLQARLTEQNARAKTDQATEVISGGTTIDESAFFAAAEQHAANRPPSGPPIPPPPPEPSAPAEVSLPPTPWCPGCLLEETTTTAIVQVEGTMLCASHGASAYWSLDMRAPRPNPRNR